MDILVKKPNETEIKEMQNCATWEKEVSTFSWHYDTQETCLIIDGEVEIKTDTQTVSFKAGDYIVFPAGLDCVWNVKKPLKKYYKFN